MLAWLMCVHFIADFLCQPREMGKKKSSEPKWLAGHLLIQFLWFLPFTSLPFALLNCMVHGVIDWNIWRGYKYFVGTRLYDKEGNDWKSPDQGRPCHRLMSDAGEWQYWEDHWFYATIGLDQLLHFLTIYYLSKFLGMSL